MPRILDNIDLHFLEALQKTIDQSDHADFCVGYFNLRGWKRLHSYIDQWPGGEGGCCRLLVGMMQTPREELVKTFSANPDADGLDQQTVVRYKRKLAQEFRDQLTIGVPTDSDEIGLRKLADQIRQKKVVVKLYLRHSLHAKLYLLYRPTDATNPIVGYVGSSNLTLRGLSQQGELNVDVTDIDACEKLRKWFGDRWEDRWCVDISDDLVEVIEESWVTERPPYHIYVKMAYHLSQEARSGLAEFRIPKDFGNRLFEFQIAAVKIAAHHLNKRNGVLIGDVVGLGKTLMATALARIFEDDQGLETLIICPKNLTPMWDSYRKLYRMRATIMSITEVQTKLLNETRHRLLILDESHNLRNREGKRYKTIQAFIEKNDCKVILLSATPYNKTYLDLSSQLRLFVSPDQDIGVRPEQLLKQFGETEFLKQYQAQPRTLAAFEKSPFADDWRDLMRLYMVRRTRSFIKDNYAEHDSSSGRTFLRFADGTRTYFPNRVPDTVKFTINDKDPADQYARMYHKDVVQVINTLKLPRYGLGNYQQPSPQPLPSRAEEEFLADLGRAGNRLIGFCRTNLFKRLESSGMSFLMSVERHILRNYIFLHAIENGLPLPIGTQDTDLLDTRFSDEDRDSVNITSDNGDDLEQNDAAVNGLTSDDDFRAMARSAYELYSKEYQGRFKWLRSSLFDVTLGEHLLADSSALLSFLNRLGAWVPAKDTKLNALHKLLENQHPKDKVLVFSQFADTVRFINRELQNRGVQKIDEVTGDSANPTMKAWRFAPSANERYIASDDELRILITTDILSEGQNLQDCNIVVNYDLPWAIIRLIQRAGRVDRIGQKHDEVLCYSFLPAEGVERVINLRGRVRQRLKENAEVVGADESFFEDDGDDQAIVDLYNEKSGILDGDDDSEVDLASYAYQIWQNAIEADPGLKKTIEKMPDVVYSTKPHEPTDSQPEGVLAYMRTSQGNDMLAWLDKQGNSITESQLAVLRAAECEPDTSALSRFQGHHQLVQSAVAMALKETSKIGGQLGRPSGARFRTYERLRKFVERIQGQVWDTPDLRKVIEEIYTYPLRQTATDALNRQLRAEATDEALAELCITLRSEGRLCQIADIGASQEPKIICSLGLRSRD